MHQELGFEVKLDQPYEQAIETVTAALKTQGFGVLTRIDVQATLKEKINAEFRPYAILGACNPPLAHRALSHAPEIGLLLPCNVTVEESGPGQSLVRFVNPQAMLQGIGPSDDVVLAEVAADALQRFQRIIEGLKQSQPM